MGKGTYNGGSSMFTARGFGTLDAADPKSGKTKLAKASLSKGQRKDMKKREKSF